MIYLYYILCSFYFVFCFLNVVFINLFEELLNRKFKDIFYSREFRKKEKKKSFIDESCFGIKVEL